jgi:hypothetical protein
MLHKRSQHELKRLVEQAVSDVCGLPRPGLWFCVDVVEPHGRPPERLKVWATLHFLPEGSPFCCGESGCHLGLRGEILREVGEHIRRTMGLRQEVSVDFGHRIGVHYHPGVVFHHGVTDV